jgi:anti-sigma B factor antagonist
MAASGCVVRVHQGQKTVTYQVEGRATMDHGLALRRCAEQTIACGVTVIRADLHLCTFMDSTFIGTLLHVKRAIGQCNCGELVLLSPSQQCCRLLHQMGLDGVFSVVMTEETCDQDWSELPAAPRDVGTFQRNIFQAHEELAALPGCVGEKFRAVTDTIRKDLERKEIQGTNGAALDQKNS